jgi:hypothetical protein
MRTRKLLLVTLSAALLYPHVVIGQSTWRVVAGASGSVAAPGLPAGERSYTDVLLGDAGNGYAGIRITSPSSAAGYWALKQGTWTRYTQIGSAGDILGPGRTGSESGHVFLDVVTGGSGAGADGQRVYIARAGDAGNTQNATWGIWRWDTSRNIEVARVLTDGPLGPALGTGWVFPNSSSFSSARAMNGGRVLINADVTTPTGASRRFLAKHVPGQGNVPCMLRQSTEPGLSPGLGAGDYFDASWGISSLALTPSGRVYGAFSTSARYGIWEVCDGAPRALAVNNETGARGPDIGIATATFATTSFGTPRPGNPGSFYFFASFRPTDPDTSRLGLFWNDGTSNRPLAMNDSAGTYGPGWEGTTWNSFDTNTLMSAGSYAAFNASARTTDGGNPSGLWRVRAGGRPELVALIGLTGAYGPEPNRTWEAFYSRAIFSNGDILVSARTNPGAENAFWLLKAGSPPERVLATGRNVSVPTSAGVVQAAVTSITIDNGVADYSGGGDSWAGADGSVLIQADVAGYGGARLMAIPSNLVDRIFVTGFDR